jgi:hypothetical protein
MVNNLYGGRIKINYVLRNVDWGMKTSHTKVKLLMSIMKIFFTQDVTLHKTMMECNVVFLLLILILHELKALNYFGFKAKLIKVHQRKKEVCM